MKYYEVKFSIKPYSADASDLLAAVAGEAGFETFEETADGLTGYIQQPLFSRELLDSAVASFPYPAVAISYTVGEAEDRDWNEQWEQEGFDPIVITGSCQPTAGHPDQTAGNGCRTIIVHDGRHLPAAEAQPLAAADAGRPSPAPAGQPSPLTIEIDARLAFGTGTHETTRMVCATLIATDMAGRRVLDCGCGTGILGIAAMKLGARQCVSYDIDEWSVDNTRHNAVINQVELTTLLGDATVLDNVEGEFDIVMANINRNILLHDMPALRSKMATGGLLIVSGFYTDDIAMLTAKAESLQLRLAGQRQEGGWACLTLQATL